MRWAGRDQSYLNRFQAKQTRFKKPVCVSRLKLQPGALGMLLQNARAGWGGWFHAPLCKCSAFELCFLFHHSKKLHQREVLIQLN